MRILVKLGGTLLDAPESRNRLARELAAVQAGGIEMVVVHGGGKQMTRFLAERGVESRFAGGLRVTTPEVLDAVLKVFAGSVNHELVAAFVAAGARAVGLSGIDAALAEAERMSEELGAEAVPNTAGGTSDGRFIAPTGAEVVELGALNSTIHKTDECVAVTDLGRLSHTYRRVLELLLT